jgi:hypothetical protein
MRKLIPGVGSTGLDDGPYLPGYGPPRKKPAPKTAQPGPHPPAKRTRVALIPSLKPKRPGCHRAKARKERANSMIRDKEA